MVSRVARRVAVVFEAMSVMGSAATAAGTSESIRRRSLPSTQSLKFDSGSRPG